MSFQEMTLEALWANEPDHDWMVGDCPDKKCSEWYKLHTKWLNEVNHRFRLFEAEVKRLTDVNSGLSELTQGMDYCAEESDKKRKDAEGRLAKAQDHLKMTIDSLEDGRPQITHSYYVACIKVRLDELGNILGGQPPKGDAPDSCTKGGC